MVNSEPEPSSPPNVLRRLATGRFFWMLIATIGLILFSGESPDTGTGRWMSVIPFILLLVGATVAARGGRRLLLTTIVFNTIFLSAWCSYYFHPHPATMVLTLLSLLACLFIALLSTLRFVLREGRVTADHIMGAICSYALIAMIFATIYTMQWMGSPSAFKGLDDPSDRPWPEFFYFSCTTLSTVGYGDIVPASTRTRSVVVVEQMTGTFYVAILIARLANLYPPPRRKDEDSSSS